MPRFATASSSSSFARYGTALHSPVDGGCNTQHVLGFPATVVTTWFANATAWARLIAYPPRKLEQHLVPLSDHAAMAHGNTNDMENGFSALVAACGGYKPLISVMMTAMIISELRAHIRKDADSGISVPVSSKRHYDYMRWGKEVRERMNNGLYEDEERAKKRVKHDSAANQAVPSSKLLARDRFKTN